MPLEDTPSKGEEPPSKKAKQAPLEDYIPSNGKGGDQAPVQEHSLLDKVKLVQATEKTYILFR